jgi:hypothetical protein
LQRRKSALWQLRSKEKNENMMRLSKKEILVFAGGRLFLH